MSKFQKGARVIFRGDDGDKHRGKITAVLPEKKRVKVVTDTEQRFEVPVRRLQFAPDRVLILEARLSRNLRSRRLYGEMFKQWLSAYDVETLYERVHTVEDVRRFLRKEGRDVYTRFIHLMCHGEDLPGKGTARLCLTLDKLDLTKDKDVFENLKGKIIIFSCCEIGNDIKAMEEIKQISQASAVISYRKSVLDAYTNLTEVLLYDRLINTRKHPRIIVDQVERLLRKLGVRFTDTHEKAWKPVLVCV